jgi:lambda family phage tail tape measure protein
MAGDITFGIRLTVDGKQATGELRAQEQAIQRISAIANQSNQQASASAEQFVQSLKRQADTLGMTRAQTLAYEASQHSLTKEQQASVVQSLRAIDAYDRKQQMLRRVSIAAASAGAAIGASLVASLRASINAALEAEQAELKLEAVLRATAGAAGISSAQIIEMSEDFQRRLGINDEAVKNSAAILLTFRQVTGESFREAMEVAANLSKVMGTDLQSAVLQLGKALEEPEVGLTALRRAGVSFSAAQRELIKDLVETGQQARAVTEILRVMKEQGLDRVAESMHTGLARATSDLKNTFDDLLETIGRTSVVKGTVEAVFGSLRDYLTDMKNVIASGTWFERLTFFTLGYSSKRVVGMRQGANTGGATVEFGESEEQARRRLKDAREAYEQFMRQFRSDNEKLEEDLRKLRTLYQQGAMSAEEFARAQRAILEKYRQTPSIESMLSAGRAAVERDERRLRAELDVLRAALSAADEIYRSAYENREVSLQDYYSARRAIIERGEQAERQEIENTIRNLEAEYARITSLRGRNAEERAKIQERAQDIVAQIEVARLALAKLDIQTSAKLAQVFRAEQKDLQAEVDQAMARAQAIVQATESSLQSRVVIGLETEATARRKLRETIGEQGRALERDLIPRIEALMAITSDPRRLAELQAIVDKIREMIDAAREKSWLDGVQSGLKEYSTAVIDTFQSAKEAVTRTFKGMEDALINFVKTGKLSFRDLADSIISDMLRIAIQRNITQPLAQFFGLMFHGGGIVGESAPGRSLPAAVFAGAPRLHGGAYLAPDEVPAILRRGEAVFTPAQLRALGGKVTVNVINNSPAQVRTEERQDGGERVIDVIIDQVTGLIGRDIARGGGLAPLLERRYGLTPAAGALR